MPKFKIRAVFALMMALILCAACALFPPRHARGGTDAIPRVFLFSSDIRSDVRPSSTGANYYSAEIDAGHLLAECVVIMSICGVAALYFCLEHWQWKGEHIWNS